MEKLFSALLFAGMLGAAAMATPTENASSTDLDTRPDMIEVLYDLDLAATAERVKSKVPEQATEVQFFPPFPGQCEGYVAPPGCAIVFNDGDFCTQQCGLFLEVCYCVR